MNLATFALRNLRVQKIRTVATFTGIALAVASFVALNGLARGIEQTMKGSLDVRGTDLVLTEAGAVDLISSIVSSDLEVEIAAFPGVEATAAELTRVSSLENGALALIFAWPIGGYPWQTLEIVAGRLPDSTGGTAVAIGEDVAERQALSIGDKIILFQTEFTVVGIVGSRSVLTRNLVLLDINVVQDLTFREGQATSINVRLDLNASVQEKEAIVEALQAAFPGYSLAETEQLAGEYIYAKLADTLSASISIIVFASAILTIFNTMSMAVNERRAEIAIMTAVGWPKSQVVACILFEATILTVSAGLVGCLAGVAAATAISQSNLVTGFIDPDISPALLVQAVVISLAIGLVGSLPPALRTANLFPADILRGR